MMISDCPPMFPLGLIVATPRVLSVLRTARHSAGEFLDRHSHGDWGDISEEDRTLNDRALRAGERLISMYSTRCGKRIWIITEADRSATTLLLPDEY